MPNKLIAQAAARLGAGGVVAFPTETVYGLGADARNEAAVRRVFELKGRPTHHPLIVHVAEVSQVQDWAREVPALAQQLLAHFWPGPLTLVLPARDDVPRVVTGGQDSVALRAPNHPVALALLRAFGGGLAAPSANRFGAVSPTEADHVRSSFGLQVDQILDGGPCRFGLESTIVSLLGGLPRVLRPGALPLAALRRVLGEDGIDPDDTARVPGTGTPRVPGSLAGHYAPACRLELHARDALPARAMALMDQGLHIAVLRRNCSLRGMPLPAALPQYLLPAHPEAYGRRLYARLRELDRLAFDCILVEAPPRDEDWWAVNDRLQRAAVGSGRSAR
jgi:L-threonylcarbamoyladenylate synthase